MDSNPLRVLVINQYYPPDASATAAVFRDVVGALVGAGHRVEVICGRPSYDPDEKRPWRPVLREREGDVRVLRVGSTSLDRRRMWRRALNYLTFVPLAALVGSMRRRPDVVVAGSDPPLAVWAGIVAARGRPVVYSLRDLHPEFALVSGMIRPGVITRAWGAAHDAGLRRSEVVVCLGERVADRVVAKGVAPERVEVVPDGAPAPDADPDPEVVAEIRGGAPFVVMHAGNLGGAGAWETLAEAAGRLDGARMVFVGDGFSAPGISQSGVRLIPFQPLERLASVMASGDLQVVSQRRGMEGLVVPSKLYTALAHGRPVLAVAPEETEVAQVVRSYGCGVVADPDDPGDVADKVAWARAHPEELKDMGERALRAAEDFRREQHLARFVELVELAALDGRRGKHGRRRSWIATR